MNVFDIAADDAEDHITYKCGEIHSVSDILEIISRPNEFLSDIIDTDDEDPAYVAPMGRNHHGAPRPFPFGLWFRGQSRLSMNCIPSVFRSRHGVDSFFFDEREMFTDIRLRASNIDLRGLSNLELMCLMQHHDLPTRLLDWSESPLVAAFFATSTPYYDMAPFAVSESVASEHDAALYVLNAYRLNAATNISGHADSVIFHPRDADVVVRSLMAEHTYMENVIAKMQAVDYVAGDRSFNEISEKLSILRKAIHPHDVEPERWMSGLDLDQKSLVERLRSPVAVIPRRSHPRMDSQLSCFTMHGGKMLYNSVFQTNPADESAHHQDGWHFLPPVRNIVDVDCDMRQRSRDGYKSAEGAFIKKFKISRYAVSRIMIELDRLGINESMIYPDIQNQSRYVRRRWSTRVADKPIWSLRKLKGMTVDVDGDGENGINPENYLHRLYGRTKIRGSRKKTE